MEVQFLVETTSTFTPPNEEDPPEIEALGANEEESFQEKRSRTQQQHEGEDEGNEGMVGQGSRHEQQGKGAEADRL